MTTSNTKKLTPAQRCVLSKLTDGESLVVLKRFGEWSKAYIGYSPVSVSTFNSLLKAGLISFTQKEALWGGSSEWSYTISDVGRTILVQDVTEGE